MLRSTFVENINHRFSDFISDSLVITAQYFDPRVRPYLTEANRKLAVSFIKNSPLAREHEKERPLSSRYPTVVESELLVLPEPEFASNDEGVSAEIKTYMSLQMDLPSGIIDIGKGCEKTYAFWRTRRSVLPCLSRIAQFVFSVPASSAEIERIFSTAGYLDRDKQRAQTSDTIRNCTLLNRNFTYTVRANCCPFEWSKTYFDSLQSETEETDDINY